MMTILYNEIRRHIRSDKRSFQLTVAQFFFCFVLMITSIVNYQRLYGVQQAYEAKYLDARFYRLSDQIIEEEEENFKQSADNLQRIKEFYSALSGNPNMDYIEAIFQPVSIEVSHIISDVMIEGYETGNKTSYPIPGNTDEFCDIKAVRINLAAQTEFQIEVQEGRLFGDEDFMLRAGQPVPILIGGEMKGKYRVGDMLPGYLLNRKCDFEIAGILKEGANIIYKNDMKYIDRYVVMPSVNVEEPPATPEDKRFQLMLYMQKINGMIKSKLSERDLSQIVSRESRQAGIPAPYIIGVSPDFLILWKDMSKNATMVLLFLSAISVIFSSIGLSAALTARFYSNIKEYAIHLMFGGKTGGIVLYFIAEVLAIVAAALILSSLFIILILHEDVTPIPVICAMAGLTVSVAISCMGPVMSIRKNNIIQILRRVE